MEGGTSTSSTSSSSSSLSGFKYDLAVFAIHHLYFSESMSICQRFAQVYGCSAYLDSLHQQCKQNVPSLPSISNWDSSIIATSTTSPLDSRQVYTIPSTVPRYVIDSKALATEHLDKLMDDAVSKNIKYFVGVDCEWLPDFLVSNLEVETSMQQKQQQPPSILQLAFCKEAVGGGEGMKCFIIDLMNLDSKTVTGLINKLYSTPQLTKLGKVYRSSKERKRTNYS